MQAGSIGIIGGADGPTAVYVASMWSPLAMVSAVLGVIAIVGATLLFIKRK